jgi:hypothetical protein
MKNSYPVTPIIEVLNTQIDKNTGAKRLLLFTPLKKKEHDSFCNRLTLYLQHHKTSSKRKEMDIELEKQYNFTFGDVVACGNTEMETRQANSYIEATALKINEVWRRNYKCFVNKDWKNPENRLNLPYHDDGGCSWNCLMTKLKNPKYGVLFTIPIENKSKFGLNGEY